VLTSQPARRRWPQPTRRVQLGLIVTAAFGGLTAAVGLRGALLAVGLAAIVGLLAAWVLVLPGGSLRRCLHRRWTASVTGTGWS
jgi:hypothetical protein